jgi:hypothetical protein
VLLLVVGYSVICAALKPGVRHWLEILGLSYAAGAGVVSLVLLCSSISGNKPSRLLLGSVFALAIALLIFSRRRKCGLQRPSVPEPRQKVGPLTLLSVVSISVLLLSACNVWARAGWPALFNVDSFAIWMFKAKVLATQPLRPIPVVLLDPTLSYSHQDYPLSFPFLIAGLYTALGRIDDSLIRIVLLPVYLSMIAVMYAAVRRMHRRSTSLTITALFATAPIISQNAGFGVAETPLILAYCAALSLLLQWMQTGESGCLPLAGLFAAIGAFTKNEGLALLPVLGLATLFALLVGRNRHNKKQAILAAGLCILAILPWLVYRIWLPKTHEDYGGKLANPTVIFHNLSRTKIILEDFIGRCANVQEAGLLWVLLLIVALLGWRSLGQPSVLVLWIILLMQLALYSATFVVTPWKLDELLPMIAGKLLAQASPVAALLIALHLRQTRWPPRIWRT